MLHSTVIPHTIGQHKTRGDTRQDTKLLQPTLNRNGSFSHGQRTEQAALLLAYWQLAADISQEYIVTTILALKEAVTGHQLEQHDSPTESHHASELRNSCVQLLHAAVSNN